MEAEETSTETEKSHPLLWAIVEFREALDVFIDEAKAMVHSLPAEPLPDEPLSPPAQAAPSGRATPTETEPTPARRFTPQGSRPWQREGPLPQPPHTASMSAPETSETVAAPEPPRPEDARQRLDALAAKLSDRRMKQTPADPSSRAGDG